MIRRQTLYYFVTQTVTDTTGHVLLSENRAYNANIYNNERRVHSNVQNWELLDHDAVKSAFERHLDVMYLGLQGWIIESDYAVLTSS